MRISWRTRPSVTPTDVAMEVERIDNDMLQLRKRVEDISTTISVTAELEIGTRQIRLGRVTLAAGANTVTFTSPIAIPYALMTQARDSANANQEVEVTARTVAGFTARVYAACTLDYLAIEE